MLCHAIEDSFVLHFPVNGSIAAWGQGNLPLAFDDDPAIVIESRDSALREEDD